MGKRYYGNMDYIPKHPDFNSSDVWQDLTRQCYDGTLDYSSYPADEYKYFDRLRLLYLEFKFNGMDKQTAAESKRKLYREYTESKRRQAVSLEVYTVYQDNIKRFEERMILINKENDPYKKLKLALEIIGMITNNSVFPKINMPEEFCDKGDFNNA